MQKQMNTKNLMVSFVAIAMALFLVATISASEMTTNALVKVNGVEAYPSNEDPAIIAGENVNVKVYFTADVDASEVTVKAELGDARAETSKFDVISNNEYKKVLSIKVPYDLKDELSDNIELDITIKGKDDNNDKVKTELDTIDLTVQRPSYDVDFKSINVAKNVEAGETFPVEIVLKNVGYNDLNDLYVTAGISALGIEKSVYAGDLVADEWNYSDSNNGETDTFSGRIYLKVPYDAKPGIYTLEVKASNDEASINKVGQIIVSNEFEKSVLKSGNELMIINPTDKVKVYTIVPDSPATVSEGLVVIQPSSSEKVTVTPNAKGNYDFNVNVLSEGKVIDTVNFKGSATKSKVTNPVVVLTIVLAIVFLVLLVILIVLVTKKPEKAEEFGESYY